jgi:uncharacterized membrane protein
VSPPDEGEPWLRPRWLIWVLPLVFFALYSASALLRDNHLGTAGYDLGIFDQVVHGFARFSAPITPIIAPGFNQLGNHFSPILAVLAPFYWIWPDRRMLLVAQAALLAVSIIPVMRTVTMRVGRWAGLAAAVAYGLSWGLQGIIGYDFHEVAFAVPLLAFSMAALADGRARAAAWWALPLLLVKEDLGLTVAMIGLCLIIQRHRRLGGALILAGIGTFLLTTMVIIPALDYPSHTYRFWAVLGDGSGGAAPAPGLGHLLGLLISLPHNVISPPARFELLLWVFGIVAFAVFRSPLALVALPTLLWRLVSDIPVYWSIGSVHYNGVLMPIMFIAAADAIDRLRRSRFVVLRGYARLVVPVALVVALVSLPKFSLWDLTRPATYEADPHAIAGKSLQNRIPSGASVAASTYLVPGIVDRCDVGLFPDTHHVPVDYVLVDTTNLYGVPLPHDQQEAYLAALPSQGYHMIAAADGIELFQRD